MTSDTRNSEKTDPTEFYRETVLRHSVEPVGYHQAIEATHEAERYNPLCGDRVTLKFHVTRERIEEAAFEGEACAICLASASLLCEHAPGLTPAELQRTGESLGALLSGEEVEAIDADLRSLAGVRKYPSRIRCAQLPWEAAEKALSDAAE